MEIIRPSTDLQNHCAELSKVCREHHQPVYMTVNGRGDTVLVGVAGYEQMRSELELLRALADGDVRAGHVAPIEETFSGIRQQLLPRTNG